jgi:hypothetical protein
MKKTLLLVSLFTLSISLSVFAVVGDSETASNCHFTGNSSDYCYASDGQHNLKVLKCVPGTTDCAYDKP